MTRALGNLLAAYAMWGAWRRRKDPFVEIYRFSTGKWAPLPPGEWIPKDEWVAVSVRTH
jgi:hypothetical protein